MSVISRLPQRSGWTRVPFGRVANRVKDCGRSELEPLSVFLDDGVVPRSSRNDNHNQLGEDLGRYLIVQPGDIVFNKLRTWQGGLGVSKYTGIVSPAYFVCRPTEDYEPRFLHYLLRSTIYLQELTRISKWQPPAQFDIGWEQLRGVQISAPSKERQIAIADYLDTETARIDALIEKKQQLIAVANERRRTLISHKVIGTDRAKNASRTRLRFIATINPHSPLFETLPLETEVAFAPLEAVWADGLDLAQRRVLADVSAGYTKFQEGDILIPKITPTFQADRAVIAKHLPNGVAVGTTELHIVRVSQGYDARYIRYLFSCRNFLDGGEAEMIGVAGQKRVPEIWLKNFPVPVLDSGEQRAIADFLDTETAHLDKTVRSTLRQVLLIRERRQALITAAVSGELEVPGVAA